MRGARRTGGGFNFGSENYMIAFLGKPSKTQPWILQLRTSPRHQHLLQGDVRAPRLLGHVAAQPTVWKDDQQRTHDPLAPMRESSYGLPGPSRPSSQNRRSSRRFNDVYVGPQKDGKFPPRAKGSGLSFPMPQRFSSRRRSRPGRVIAPRASNTASSTRPNSTRSRCPTRNDERERSKDSVFGIDGRTSD